MPSYPTTLSPCPSYIKLDPSKMRIIDGRDPKTWFNQPDPAKPGSGMVGARFRPWDGRPVGQAQHSVCVMENYRVGWHTDKAVHINTGSTDKAKVNGQVQSFTQVIVRNLHTGPLLNVTNTHMDHLWFGGGHDPAIRPDVLIEDFFAHDSDGGTMPILWECGDNWGNVVLRRIGSANVQHPFFIKCDRTHFLDFLIEDCHQGTIHFEGVGPAFKVRIRNCQGMRITKKAEQVTFVYEDASIVIDPPPPPRPTPAPLDGLAAEVNQLTATARSQGEQIARLTEAWGGIGKKLDAIKNAL